MGRPGRLASESTAKATGRAAFLAMDRRFMSQPCLSALATRPAGIRLRWRPAPKRARPLVESMEKRRECEAARSLRVNGGALSGR
jgi:hypothetical protein